MAGYWLARGLVGKAFVGQSIGVTQLYRLDATAAQVAATFAADPGGDPWQGGYVTPGQFAPVVINIGESGRRLVPRLWGVPPPPAAAAGGGAPVTQVRNLASPFWTGTLRHSEYRCLVPATAFQLWSQARDPQTGKRIAQRISLPAAPIFALAGIWRDSEVLSFALLACEPNRLVGAINPRTMPVILHAEDHETWLRADWPLAQKLVAPFPSQLMRSERAGGLALDQ